MILEKFIKHNIRRRQIHNITLIAKQIIQGLDLFHFFPEVINSFELVLLDFLLDCDLVNTAPWLHHVAIHKPMTLCM